MEKIEINKEVLRDLIRSQIYEANLEGILIRDKNEKPRINLLPLKKIAVNPKPEEYSQLMRVYEAGNRRWADGKLPTENFCGGLNSEYCNIDLDDGDFCIIETDRDADKYNLDRVLVPIIKVCASKHGHGIISPQEFYEIQKITPQMLKEINKYFENKK